MNSLPQLLAEREELFSKNWDNKSTDALGVYVPYSDGMVSKDVSEEIKTFARETAKAAYLLGLETIKECVPDIHDPNFSCENDWNICRETLLKNIEEKIALTKTGV